MPTDRESRTTQGNPVMEDRKVEAQTIAQGPMASQVAIKMLGTNGGGFINANAAHPYENPTPLSNFSSNAVDFSDTERIDLLSRAYGEEPEDTGGQSGALWQRFFWQV